MSYFAKIRVIAMKKLTETILNLVFPPKCPFCGKVLDAVGVCPPCEKALPWIPEEQAALSEGDLTCAAPLWYEENVREALLRLKFRGGSALAEPLGELLAQCAAEQFGGEFDTVTWVPVSRKRLKRRGYDQSRLLAEAACRRWDTRPVRLLTKIQDNPAQSGLRNEAARRVNVLGVYDPAESETIRGRRILLIDDICTTGATLRECVRVLRDNGAAAVLCLTVAKTPNNEKKEKNSQIVSCNQGNTQV